MARKPRSDFADTFHHVFSRGNGRQTIFRDDEDRSFFVRRLDDLSHELDFSIFAYCLMDNHFHIALQRRSQPLKSLMHRLLTAYARVFNDRWNTVGHAFQGRYGSRLLKDDVDLVGVIRYIHANPVAAHAAGKADDWKWSGHRQLANSAKGILDTAFVLDLFGDAAAYATFMAQPAPASARASLAELAGSRKADIRGPGTDRATSAQRVGFIESALEAGYRRAEIARYLNRSAGAITKLLARNVKV